MKISKHDIRKGLQDHGVEGYCKHVVRPLLEGTTMPNNGAKYHVPAQDWSLKAIWEATVGDVSDTLEYGNLDRVTYKEAVDSTAFSIITAELISNKLIEGYNAPGFIGDELVDVMPSSLRSERIVGFTHSQGMKTVGEGMPYEESSIGEKYVTNQATKKGRLISITEEMIKFDQTGQLLRRAQLLGEEARTQREEDTLNGVTGTDAQVFKPSGTAETLYSAGNTNLNTTNALEDYSDIESTLLYHVTNMRDDRQGETTKRLVWNPNILLVPVALLFTAKRTVNATFTRETTNSNSVGESPNPVGDMGIRILSSPFLDGLSTTTWYLGDFRKQFIWTEIFPLQTMFRRDNTEDSWNKDIIASYKTRYYGGISAVDTRWVVQSTA